MGEKGNGLTAVGLPEVGSTSVVTSVVSTIRDGAGEVVESFSTKLQDKVTGAAVDATVAECRERIGRRSAGRASAEEGTSTDTEVPTDSGAQDPPSPTDV